MVNDPGHNSNSGSPCLALSCCQQPWLLSWNPDPTAHLVWPTEHFSNAECTKLTHHFPHKSVTLLISINNTPLQLTAKDRNLGFILAVSSFFPLPQAHNSGTQEEGFAHCSPPSLLSVALPSSQPPEKEAYLFEDGSAFPLNGQWILGLIIRFRRERSSSRAAIQLPVLLTSGKLTRLNIPVHS